MAKKLNAPAISEFCKKQNEIALKHITEKRNSAISNGLACFTALVNPKIRMKQIGGPDIIGERISLEPIIDRFGSTLYINHEGRVIKEDIYQERFAKGYLWEELSKEIHLKLSEIKTIK